MKKISVALLAQTILTFDAGTHKAIKDGGDTYLLISSSEEGSGDSPKAEPRGGENIEEAPVAEQAPTPTRQAPAQTQTAPTTAGIYVEADLTQDKKTIPELMDILEELGVNPADFEGKNTNKKLRLLILDAQDGKIVNDEEDPAPTQQATAPATTTAPTRGRGRGASAPSGPRQLTEDEVNGLDKGAMVIVKLDYGDETEGVDPEKLWEAEVTGWKVPDGDTEERLHVTFEEDGATDFIRDGDILFEYKVKI